MRNSAIWLIPLSPGAILPVWLCLGDQGRLEQIPSWFVYNIAAYSNSFRHYRTEFNWRKIIKVT